MAAADDNKTRSRGDELSDELPRFPLGSRVRSRDLTGRVYTGEIVAIWPDDDHPYAVLEDECGFRELLDQNEQIELLQTADAWFDTVCKRVKADLANGKLKFGMCGDRYAPLSELTATKLSLHIRTVAKNVDFTFGHFCVRGWDLKTLRILAQSVTNAKRIFLERFFGIDDNIDYHPILQTLLGTFAESDSLNCLKFSDCVLHTPDYFDCKCWANICSITRNLELYDCSFQQITPLWEESVKQGFQRNKALNEVKFCQYEKDTFQFDDWRCLFDAFRGPAAPKSLFLGAWPSLEGNKDFQLSITELFSSPKPALESLTLDGGYDMLFPAIMQGDVLKELTLRQLTTSIAICLGSCLAWVKNLRLLSYDLGIFVDNCEQKGWKAVVDGLHCNSSIEKLTMTVYKTRSVYNKAVLKLEDLVSAIQNTGIRTLKLVGGEYGKNLFDAKVLRDNLVCLHSLRCLDVHRIFHPRSADIAEMFLEGLNGGLMVEELIWDRSQLPPNTSFPQEQVLLKTNSHINKLVPAVKQNNGHLASSVWPLILSLVSPKACGIYEVLHADPTCGGQFQPSDD